MAFEQLFEQILPEEISKYSDVFSLTGKDYFLITAGREDSYNSMVGSGGGFGVLFRKPCTWCVIREDRYTLELLLKQQTYTISYFPQEHREKMLFLGSKTGKNTNKMAETQLTGVQTPFGNITFKEAGLIIECKLTQITMPEAEDFYEKEAKEYFAKAYSEDKVFRKYVFGEITGVWIKKQAL